MNNEVLLLSTPDLRQSNLIRFLQKRFKLVIQPRLQSEQRQFSRSIESQVTDLNQDFLNSLQKRWYQPIAFNSDAFHRDETDQGLQRILSQLKQSSWVLHDPMLAHTLPLWLSKIENPQLIFYFSEPMQCAHALQRAWRFPVAFGLALWENYVLSAVNSMRDHDCLLISESQLQIEGQEYLEPILEKLGISWSQDSWSIMKPDLPIQEQKTDTLSQACNYLYSALEAGDITTLEKTTISAQSADILEHYGALRSGFEIVKTERDLLKFNKNPREEVIEKPTANLIIKQPQKSNAPTFKLILHLSGRDALELYTEQDSPILTMLRDRMSHPQTDDLVFLNCGSEHGDALYFMSSDLLALELHAAE